MQDQVPLDVCPSSNVAIGLSPSLETHPVRELLAAGANVTISSDDRPLFGVTLMQELRAVVSVASLDRAGLADLQRRAAFLSSADRRALGDRILAWQHHSP